MSNSKFRPKKRTTHGEGRRKLPNPFSAVDNELKDNDLVILKTEVFERFSYGARSLEFLPELDQDMSARRRI